MNIVTANIKWIMLVSGALTCTMIYAAIAPEAALQANFGEALEGPVAAIIVRNWSVLVTLMGIMLIYGAFTPSVRSFALAIAGISKLVFILLVLSHGARYLGYQAGIAVAVDLVWVLVFAAYLLTHRAEPAR